MEERLAALLRDAGRAHHQAFIDVNGEDPDWPAWYARYLAPELGAMMGRIVDVGALTVQLAQLEAARQRDGSKDWPRYYAARIAGVGVRVA